MSEQKQAHIAALQKSRERLGRLAFIGGASVALLIIVSAFLIQLSGAVIANGFIVPRGENIVLQHADGGLVKDVFVENGDVVEAGAEIVRFDETALKSELDRLETLRLGLGLRVASTRAALDGKNIFEWSEGTPGFRRRRPAALITSAASSLATPSERFKRTRVARNSVAPKAAITREAHDAIARQRAALRADRTLYQSRIQQVQERINGSIEALSVLQGQLVSIDERSNLIESEIEELAVLVEDRLVPRSRMTSLQRERLEIQQRAEGLRLEDTRLAGEIALARKDLASIRDEDANRLWTLLQADQEELATVTFDIDNVRAQLGRMAVIAPVTGRIHELAVGNAGTVVQAGQVVVQVVPSGQASEVSVQIDLASIDDVGVGQDVRLRFDTFKKHAATELKGQILQISPDRSLDPATGLPFYSARIGLDEASMADFGAIGPIAGAPVTVMILTQKRSMADYLLEPVKDALFKSFSEA